MSGQVTTLPMNEDTRSLISVFVEQINRDVIAFTNGTGSAITDKTFIVFGGNKWCGVNQGDVANGDIGYANVEEGILLQVDDLVTSEDTFATVGQDVYYDASAGEFSDTWTAGYYKVGKLVAAKDSEGMIKFEKFRYAEIQVAAATVIAPGEIGWISFPVDEDATTALSNDFGFNFNILDAFIQSDATNTSATIKLQDSSDNDISDAMIATPVLTQTRVGTIDGITNSYNEIADGTVKFIANGAADRGTVYMLVEGVV